MRLVIDLQGTQTESHKRGIGRYSLALALTIARNRGEHEIVLALNGRFPDRIEPIRAGFDGLLPQDKIRKSLHRELGLFDTSFKSAGDWEFWLRCLWKGKKFYRTNTPHVVYYQKSGWHFDPA
jgi:hypothetical protein